MHMKVIKDLIVGLHRLLFSRWRFLTLYITFTVIAVSGWYIDIVGWFSSSEDYAASVKAQYGDINILNVLVFIMGSMVFLVYLWVDMKNKRLEKIITGDVTIKNSTLLGDANQAVANAENSQAISAPQGQITINNITGITEERCRDIFDEKLPVALRDYSAEAEFVAKDRAFKFRQKLVPRLGEEENGFASFIDPSFQFLLIEAQKAAASTDREADYDVLSELLANRVKVGTDRQLYLGINKAVSVLPFVSDDQLAGMTIRFCIAKIYSKSNNIIGGLSVLDDCYGKILGKTELPEGNNWLDSLEAGGLVKDLGLPLHSFKKSRDIFFETFNSYTITGIQKNSERYRQALDLLKGVGLPESMLIEHELNSDYVRLIAIDVDSIDALQLNRQLENGAILSIPLNDNQKDVLKSIMALYEGEMNLKEDFKNRFISKVREYPNLMKVMDWWDTNTTFFELTIVGKILANANANKCDARIPIIVK